MVRMELIRDLDKIDPRFKGGVVSVGVFDGVHVGHQKVLGHAVERARELGVASVAFTFHPHPLGVLRPDEAPPLIQTFGRKLEIFRQIGIAACIWPDDAERVLAMAPRRFVSRVLGDTLGVRVIVEGSDFHFGAGASGDVASLSEIAGTQNVEVEIVGDVLVDGERVSSTRIRSLITDGRVADVARCLGRPYTYVGTVVEGCHRGERLGYPTANLDAPRFLVPAEGVYAGRALVRGRRHLAAVSVGRAPSFPGEHPVAVEAFLLDFDGELYGEQMTLEFLQFLRPQEAFSNPDALRAQMAADCERVRKVLTNP